MTELELLWVPTEAPATRIESHDPRFLAVVDLADHGKLAEAAEAARALLEEGVRDLRLASYVALDHALRSGFAALAQVLQSLGRLLAEEGGELGPDDRRWQQLDKSLGYFIDAFLERGRYHQQKGDDTWRSWFGLGITAHLDAAVQEVNKLSERVVAPPFKRSSDGLARFAAWLREVQASIPAAPAEPAASSKPPAPSGGVVLRSPRLSETMEIRGAAPFVLLCDKLKAFEMLVEKRDFARAALVSNDILDELSAFDPRRYFPDLFSRFSELLSHSGEEIARHWERKDSMEWKLLEQFYRVDLVRFVGEE